ncbi:hypothetical protein QOZ73_32805, partial [Pseudomonas aeruginosa]|uniref:hypothetical protein n=1 Tax=Pseudomonas aeruginosa TaxID=287 RepID=UPI00345B31B1
MFEFLTKLLPDANAKIIRSYADTVERINALELKMQALSDEELRGCTPAFKERIAAGETLDEILPEAFAAVREASRRK